jgi:hypothetical protein
MDRLKWLLKLEMFAGVRAYAAGLALICLGAAGVICNFAGCDTHGLDQMQSVSKIAEGLGIIGIRAKFTS